MISFQSIPLYRFPNRPNETINPLDKSQEAFETATGFRYFQYVNTGSKEFQTQVGVGIGEGGDGGGGGGGVERVGTAGRRQGGGRGGQ